MNNGLDKDPWEIEREPGDLPLTDTSLSEMGEIEIKEDFVSEDGNICIAQAEIATAAAISEIREKFERLRLEVVISPDSKTVAFYAPKECLEYLRSAIVPCLYAAIGDCWFSQAMLVKNI